MEAQRKLDVGRAEIEKQKIEQLALAERIKLTVEAEGHSSEIAQVGKAEADVIRIKKEADAAGTLKLAEALKQFNEVAINVKILDIHRDVMLAKFAALSQAIKEADIKWIMSGANAQKFFGLNLDAEGGANIQQFFQESGLDLDRLKALLKEKK
ncbi:MAG: hypothetical protein HYY90_00430 [Candidatus Omnitrophica bacterium]|nr:hypothetical protein [Candidatus Omnitrophota bacterium]